jgi:hypothetical protein
MQHQKPTPQTPRRHAPLLPSTLGRKRMLTTTIIMQLALYHYHLPDYHHCIQTYTNTPKIAKRCGGEGMEWSGIDRMNECTLSKRQLTAGIVASPQHDRQGNITSNRDLALHDATNLCSTWACRHPIHTHTKVAPSCFRYPSVSAV